MVQRAEAARLANFKHFKKKQVIRRAFCSYHKGPGEGHRVFSACLDLVPEIKPLKNSFHQLRLVPEAEMQGRPALDSSDVLRSQLEAHLCLSAFPEPKGNPGPWILHPPSAA